MLALGAALRLLQGLHGVAGVARHFPQLPQPPSKLGHAGVQRVQTDVHLVQACVQAGQATHCGWTGRTLDGDPGGGARVLEDVGGTRDLRLLGRSWGEGWAWDFPGKNTGVRCHFLLQGIFLTQGSNPGLLHCRQILYQLSHQGSLCNYLQGFKMSVN